MKYKDLLIFESPEHMAVQSACLIAGAVRNVVSQKGHCKMALAGGNTPRSVYKALSNTQIVGAVPFEQVDILFGDERCVPPSNEQSNFNMAANSLLSSEITFNSVHRIEGELPDRSKAANRYEQHLKEPIDILLLGMGSDAHIASIFPGSLTFAHRSALAMPVKSPKSPLWRITITPQVVINAHHTFVLIQGKEKAQALERVFYSPTEPAKRPAQLIVNGTWIMDKDAASNIVMFQNNKEANQ